MAEGESKGPHVFSVVTLYAHGTQTVTLPPGYGDFNHRLPCMTGCRSVLGWGREVVGSQREVLRLPQSANECGVP